MTMRRSLVIGLMAASAVIVACTGEEAVPLDELPPDEVPGAESPSVTHALEPTDEMRDLARQQCLDDPDLAEGYIEAVDPANADQVLVSVTVDCDEVR